MAQLSKARERESPSSVAMRERDQLTSPMVVTELPNVTLVSLEHSPKASCESRRSQRRHGAAEGRRRKGNDVVRGDARARSAHLADGRHRVADRHAREFPAPLEGVLRVAAIAGEAWRS